MSLFYSSCSPLCRFFFFITGEAVTKLTIYPLDGNFDSLYMDHGEAGKGKRTPPEKSWNGHFFESRNSKFVQLKSQQNYQIFEI